MTDFLGNFRDELDSRRTCTNDTHPLAGEVQVFLGPMRSMEAHALEALTPRKIGDIRSRQDSNRGNQKSRLRPTAIAGLDLPAIGGLSIDCRGNAGAELDVAA